MNRFIDIKKISTTIRVVGYDGEDSLVSLADVRRIIHYAAANTSDDVVEVVRCKDCRYYRNHPNGLCYCWTEPCENERGYKGEVHCVEPDDFCSQGERRENDDG